MKIGSITLTFSVNRVTNPVMKPQITPENSLNSEGNAKTSIKMSTHKIKMFDVCIGKSTEKKRVFSKCVCLFLHTNRLRYHPRLPIESSIRLCPYPKCQFVQRLVHCTFHTYDTKQPVDKD